MLSDLEPLQAARTLLRGLRDERRVERRVVRRGQRLETGEHEIHQLTEHAHMPQERRRLELVAEAEAEAEAEAAEAQAWQA